LFIYAHAQEYGNSFSAALWQNSLKIVLMYVAFIGSGYITACLGQHLGPGGTVVGVEINGQLVPTAQDAIEKLRADGTIKCQNVVIVQGDALDGKR
jgi:protein-L-isoaspartate O-methyltransferase